MDKPEASGGLHLVKVTAGYGARSVLREVTLSAPPGVVTGLIGPNGSGKTTLLRVAARGLRPATGRVRVGGWDPYALSARRAARLVAVVPQEVSTAFSYTVLEMVLMGRAPYLAPWGGGRPEDWARARAAMDAAGVRHLADRPVDELSGGERQRVVLAQALAQEAPTLLLDEPTTHLDVRHVVEMLELIRAQAWDRSTAVLAIFHDLNLAGAYCDRVYAMKDGRVVTEGRPEEVIRPDVVRDVFGVEAWAVPSASGRPAVIVADRVVRSGPTTAKVHVIGGAGRAAEVLRSLLEEGFEVTAGVLHETDTDAVVAERLNLVRVVVAPFSHVDPRSAADGRTLAASADVLVVCDAPFGPGNVENLRIALDALRGGVPTVVLDRVPIEERDFTAGEAAGLWRAVTAGGAVVRSVGDAVSAVTRATRARATETRPGR